MPHSLPGPFSLVPFVSVDDMMKLVIDIGPERMPCELAGEIEADFRRWEAFDKTPRVAAHSKDGVIELMPTSDAQAYGFKYVNGHLSNTHSRRQTVTAFGVLADVETGYPLTLTEMTLLTALRTAATSAMVTRHLMPKGADSMAMIGNGAQSEFQSLAYKAVCGVKRVQMFDIDPKATAKAVKNLENTGLEVIPCETPEEAVQGAQIITTCTADKQYATILSDNMVCAGVHINAIGGEIQQLDADHPVTELWQVITGKAAGRNSDRQMTLFDSVGFATEDFSAL